MVDYGSVFNTKLLRKLVPSKISSYTVRIYSDYAPAIMVNYTIISYNNYMILSPLPHYDHN